jgi:hypothetical protein
MRFEARHIGSGVWGVWDGGVMGWRADDLGANEAKQQAADMNVMFNQWHQRAESERREVKPPVPVDSAEWSTAGLLDYWVREDMGWLGRVRGPDGHHVWIKASDLRQAKHTE